MKYFFIFTLIISGNIFADKIDIEKKYYEVFIELEGMKKSLGPMAPDIKEYIYNSGILEGLRFSLEHYQD